MKYQKCKKCKMEIPKKAKVCHHCGANQGMGCGTAIVILVFLVLLLSIPFMANKGDKTSSDKPATSKSESTSTTPQSSTPPETKYPTINGFIIGDKKGTTDDFGCTVKGVVANATGKDCDYVQITIGFYDENDTKITSGIDNVLNLKSGESWKYTVYGLGSDITSFRVEEITWY